MAAGYRSGHCLFFTTTDTLSGHCFPPVIVFGNLCAFFPSFSADCWVFFFLFRWSRAVEITEKKLDFIVSEGAPTAGFKITNGKTANTDTNEFFYAVAHFRKHSAQLPFHPLLENYLEAARGEVQVGHGGRSTFFEDDSLCQLAAMLLVVEAAVESDEIFFFDPGRGACELLCEGSVSSQNEEALAVEIEPTYMVEIYEMFRENLVNRAPAQFIFAGCDESSRLKESDGLWRGWLEGTPIDLHLVSFTDLPGEVLAEGSVDTDTSVEDEGFASAA